MLKDTLLILGYSLSFMTCGVITVLIIWYRLKIKNNSNNDFDIVSRTPLVEDIIAILPGNVYWKDRDGQMLGCNDNQLRALNLSAREDYIGKTDLNLQYDETVAKKIMEHDKLVMSMGCMMTFDEDLVDVDGINRTYFTNKIPLKNKFGDIAGVLGVSIDVTKNKEEFECYRLTAGELFLAKMIEEATGIKSEKQRTIEEKAKMFRDYFEN